jgi:hypothetical protein
MERRLSSASICVLEFNMVSSESVIAGAGTSFASRHHQSQVVVDISNANLLTPGNPFS